MDNNIRSRSDVARRIFLYWNLQMSRRLKFGLMALTGGGFIVGAAAILKTIYIRVIQVTDDVTCMSDFIDASDDFADHA